MVAETDKNLLQRAGIKPESGTVEDMLQGFRDFKHRVPTYGGLLLNQDLSHVLLVQVYIRAPLSLVCVFEIYIYVCLCV